MALKEMDSYIYGIPYGGPGSAQVRHPAGSTPQGFALSGRRQDADYRQTVVVGEICNFAAYAFAPAILVTPLGALAVLIGAVLGSYVLNEELGILGKLGSAICLLGAIIIVLHAPPDEDIQNIETLLAFALRPGTNPSALRLDQP